MARTYGGIGPRDSCELVPCLENKSSHMGTNVAASTGEKYFHPEIGLNAVKYWEETGQERSEVLLGRNWLEVEYMKWVDILAWVYISVRVAKPA